MYPFQTNHLSHFLLTAELYPLLEAEAIEYGDARIVNHSSLGRWHTQSNRLQETYFGNNGGSLGGNRLQLFRGPCYERYFQSKLANSVFTYGLHEKLSAKHSKVHAVCAHPGGSATNLANGLDFGWFWNMCLPIFIRYFGQTSEDGSTGLIKGMMDPDKGMMDPDAASGVLYGPTLLKGPVVPNEPRSFVRSFVRNGCRSDCNDVAYQ